MYLVVFLRRLQPKQSSPIKQFSLSKTISKEVNMTANTAAIAFFLFLLTLSIYPFLVLFQGDFRVHFAFGLFLVKRLQFSFGTFSNIQQGNALAFTATYTLIFVNVLTSSNTSFTFLKFFVFLLLKVNWRGGEDSFTNSLRCATMQSF